MGVLGYDRVAKVVGPSSTGWVEVCRTRHSGGGDNTKSMRAMNNNNNSIKPTTMNWEKVLVSEMKMR